MNFYSVDLYDRLLLDQRDKSFNTDMDIKEVLLDHDTPDDNIWGADIGLVIFLTKEGYYGVYTSYPAGYSECTYDPDITSKVYKNLTLDEFFDLVLDGDQRELFRDSFNKLKARE